MFIFFERGNKMIQNYINHIAFVLDASGSMNIHSKSLVSVFDNEIKNLKNRSQELDQETRLSIYTFSGHGVVNCLVFDMDVMRMKSIATHYRTSGNTNLIDANLKAIGDMKKLPELYGDHAFLLYCLTDGEENSSKNRPSVLNQELKSLPENWTVACLVPNAHGVHEAKKFGFSSNNISIWDTNAKDSLETVGSNFRSAIDNYMVGRSAGIRGSSNFFSVDTTKLDNKKNLSSLNKITKPVILSNGPITKQSKDCVINAGYNYANGILFYNLIKKETIQANKEIALIEKKTGHLYYGDDARTLLNLPNHSVQVDAANHPLYNIFIQSTAPNRNIIPYQEFVLKTW